MFPLSSMDRQDKNLATLGTLDTSESLHGRLQKHLDFKDGMLKETRKNLQKVKQQLSSTQTKKEMIK